MQWTSPSLGSTVAFLAIVFVVAAAMMWAIRRAQPRAFVPATLGFAAWMAAVAAVAHFGVVEAALPASLTVVFFACNGLGLGVGVSPLGRRLADAIPTAALVGFHGFRLPLELVLHQWWAEGVIPVSMTWTGRNPDIVTGIVALMLVPMLIWPRLQRLHWWLAAAFSALGLGLLVNVGVVAVLSSPLPIRQIWDEPPLQLGLHAPYVWIVTVCVAGALLGHVVLIRRLWRTRPGVSSA